MTSSSEDDEFDDLFSFGNNNNTNESSTSSKTPGRSSSPLFDDEKDILADDDDDDNPSTKIPAPDMTESTPSRPRLASEQEDAFHKHDADTREMLAFLDDDETTTTTTTTATAGVTAAIAAGKSSSANVASTGHTSVNEEDLLKDLDVSAAGTKNQRTSSDLFDLDTHIGVGDDDDDEDNHMKDILSSGKGTSNTGNTSANVSSISVTGGEEVPPVTPFEFDTTTPMTPSSTQTTTTPTPTPNATTAERSTGSTTRRNSSLMGEYTLPDDMDDIPDSPSSPIMSKLALMTSESSLPSPPSSKPTVPPISPPPRTYTTLSDAVRSTDSTISQIRSLLSSAPIVRGYPDLVMVQDRPHLWTKIICAGRTLDDVLASAMVDSFHTWKMDYTTTNNNSHNHSEVDEFVSKLAQTWSPRIVEGRRVYSEDGEEQQCTIEEELDQAKQDLILLLTYQQQQQMVTTVGPTQQRDEEEKKENLPENAQSKQLSNTTPPTKHDSKQKSTSSSSPSSSSSLDPLIIPLAATLLSAGIPLNAASALLNNIIPVSMPLMALQQGTERDVAVRSLHSRFYLLASYHCPLLVLHLDRNAPGWHWPQQQQPEQEQQQSEQYDTFGGERTDENGDTKVNRYRNSQWKGLVPPTWFTSHPSGGGGGGDIITTSTSSSLWALTQTDVLSLWDALLVGGDASLKFFLLLALLDDHSSKLLILRGDELSRELQWLFSFRKGQTNPAFDNDDNDNDNDTTTNNNNDNPEEEEEDTENIDASWILYDRAKTLCDSTPKSILNNLRHAEDNAMTEALSLRQRHAERRAIDWMEAEAKAHREATFRKKKEEKSIQLKARLETFYKKHNPEKLKSLDKIWACYGETGQVHVLEHKLRQKYGAGFLPILPDPNKLLSNVGQGIQSHQKMMVAALMEGGGGRRKATTDDDIYNNNNEEEERKKNGGNSGSIDYETEVVLRVNADEVMAILYGSKGPLLDSAAAAARFPSTLRGDSNLKFYLVDSRPDDVAMAQGRFPTAVKLSPEALMDPEKIKTTVEMFEGLRGAVHICVMGEGYSSLPALYDGHPLGEEEKILKQEDDSRTSNCALFFVKKGFPFVSVLNGGFAASHAWLSRNGRFESIQATSSILVDYDPQTSIFGQLEQVFHEKQRMANASTRERAQKQLQKMIDGSMTTLSKAESRIETLASDIGGKETRQKVSNSVRKMIKAGEDGIKSIPSALPHSTADSAKKKKIKGNKLTVKNPFSNLRQFAASPSREKEVAAAASAAASASKESGSEPTSVNTTNEDNSVLSPGFNPSVISFRFGVGINKNATSKQNDSVDNKSSENLNKKKKAEELRINPLAGLGKAAANLSNGASKIVSSVGEKKDGNRKVEKASKIMTPGQGPSVNLGDILKKNPFSSIGGIKTSPSNSNNNNNNNSDKKSGGMGQTRKLPINGVSIKLPSATIPKNPFGNINLKFGGGGGSSSMDDSQNNMMKENTLGQPVFSFNNNNSKDGGSSSVNNPFMTFGTIAQLPEKKSEYSASEESISFDIVDGSKKTTTTTTTTTPLNLTPTTVKDIPPEKKSKQKWIIDDDRRQSSAEDSLGGGGLFSVPLGAEPMSDPLKDVFDVGEFDE